MDSSVDNAEGAAAPSAAVERLPKVRLDVLASRLLHDQDYGELSTSSSASSLSSASFSVGEAAVSTTATSSHNAAAPRMPLAALARAEAQLRRPVSLSHGGLAIHFSRDDIQHITDPEVLQLLASEAPSTNQVAAPEAASASAVSTSEMDAHMDALQKEIDTFITAVDNEGRSYEIRMGATGQKEMFIADEELDTTAELEEAKKIEIDTTRETLPEEPTRSLSTFVPDAPTPPMREKPSSAPAKPAVLPPPHKATVTDAHLRPQQQQQPHLSLQPQQVRKPPPPGTQKSARVAQRVRPGLTPTPPPPSSSAASASSLSSAHRVKSTTQPPAVPVRPQAGLTEGEESRVEQLLDSAAFDALSSTNPFLCEDTQLAQLKELEAQISRYVAVRGGPPTSYKLGDRSAGELIVTSSEAAHEAQGDTNTVAPSVAALGNAYMRDSRAAERAAQRLHSVNERLRALQRRNEALAMAPDDNTPADILALRPAWARSETVSVSEVELQALLTAAREEEARAREVGVPSLTPRAPLDPFVGLRDELRSAGSRAMALLEEYDANPPLLRKTPSPVSVSDTEEAEMPS